MVNSVLSRLVPTPGGGAGDPMGYQRGGTARVLYRGQDANVHEI